MNTFAYQFWTRLQGARTFEKVIDVAVPHHEDYHHALYTWVTGKGCSHYQQVHSQEIANKLAGREIVESITLRDNEEIEMGVYGLGGKHVGESPYKSLLCALCHRHWLLDERVYAEDISKKALSLCPLCQFRVDRESELTRLDEQANCYRITTPEGNEIGIPPEVYKQTPLAKRFSWRYWENRLMAAGGDVIWAESEERVLALSAIRSVIERELEGLQRKRQLSTVFHHSRDFVAALLARDDVRQYVDQGVLSQEELLDVTTELLVMYDTALVRIQCKQEDAPTLASRLETLLALHIEVEEVANSVTSGVSVHTFIPYSEDSLVALGDERYLSVPSMPGVLTYEVVPEGLDAINTGSLFHAMSDALITIFRRNPAWEHYSTWSGVDAAEVWGGYAREYGYEALANTHDALSWERGYQAFVIYWENISRLKPPRDVEERIRYTAMFTLQGIESRVGQGYESINALDVMYHFLAYWPDVSLKAEGVQLVSVHYEAAQETVTIVFSSSGKLEDSALNHLCCVNGVSPALKVDDHRMDAAAYNAQTSGDAVRKG